MLEWHSQLCTACVALLDASVPVFGLHVVLKYSATHGFLCRVHKNVGFAWLIVIILRHTFIALQGCAKLCSPMAD
jgi:hypothetical protein